MRLHFSPRSSASRRVVLTARHLGIALEMVDVGNLTDPEVRAALLRVNPNGKIPVLEDDGFVLWESYAIMQYLADKSAGQTIYPTELLARTDVNRWLFCCAQHWTPAINGIGWERLGKAMFGLGEPDLRELERGEKEFAKWLAVLDGHLANRPWICNAGLTLADFALAAPLMSAAPMRLPLASYPNVNRWFDRVQTVPAWQAAAAA